MVSKEQRLLYHGIHTSVDVASWHPRSRGCCILAYTVLWMLHHSIQGAEDVVSWHTVLLMLYHDNQEAEVNVVS